MPLPADFWNDDVNYRIRVCMPVALDPIIGFFTGSKVHQCDRCGEPIWVAEDQVIPPVDVKISGDVNLCADCAKWVMDEAGGAAWIDGHGPDDQ